MFANIVDIENRLWEIAEGLRANTHLRASEYLEEIAQSLYQEWFVKFRFPGWEKVGMVESEMGLVPEGWEIKELGDILTLQRGFDLPSTQRQSGDIPIYAST